MLIFTNFVVNTLYVTVGVLGKENDFTSKKKKVAVRRLPEKKHL